MESAGTDRLGVRLARTVAVLVAAGVVLAVLVAIVVITRKLATSEAMLTSVTAVRDSCPQTGEIRTYCLLEQDLTARRYGLAASGVGATLWTRYFACLSGLIMVAVGSIFILMRLDVAQGRPGASRRK